MLSCQIILIINLRDNVQHWSRLMVFVSLIGLERTKLKDDQTLLWGLRKVGFMETPMIFCGPGLAA